jgi:hypothetical protein
MISCGDSNSLVAGYLFPRSISRAVKITQTLAVATREASRGYWRQCYQIHRRGSDRFIVIIGPINKDVIGETRRNELGE